MKLFLATVLLVVLGAAAFYWSRWRLQPAPAAPPQTAAEREQCRDACEQSAIVARHDDEWLKRCRAGCEGGPTATAPLKPVIRRITVAPVDHRIDPRFAPPSSPR